MYIICTYIHAYIHAASIFFVLTSSPIFRYINILILDVCRAVFINTYNKTMCVCVCTYTRYLYRVCVCLCMHTENILTTKRMNIYVKVQST